jgi:hypothetical protein
MSDNRRSRTLLEHCAAGFEFVVGQPVKEAFFKDAPPRFFSGLIDASRAYAATIMTTTSSGMARHPLEIVADVRLSVTFLSKQHIST